MIHHHRNKRIPKILFAWILLFGNISLLSAANPPDAKIGIPREYGEIIYRYNEKSSKKLFIIGISHQDALTNMDGVDTARVQAEVFRIGEWLIQNEGVGLFLPEGFFGKKQEKNQWVRKNNPGDTRDIKSLKEILSDPKKFVNAELLLKAQYPILLEQVEDKGLYDAVCDNLFRLANVQNNPSDDSILNSEIEYLQDQRTALMLQKIPEMVEVDFREKNIKEPKAVLTIGMLHLNTIIHFLNEKKISITPPPSASFPCESYDLGLNLIKENYAVYVILPKLLWDDQEILRLNKLDKMAANSANLPQLK